MPCNWWVIIHVYLESWLLGFELNELFRFSPLHLVKHYGSGLVSYQALILMCGLILAGVWVVFQVHKRCSLSITNPRQRRWHCPWSSEPTRCVHSWPWRDIPCVCGTGWIKRSLFGCWAPGSRDTQGRPSLSHEEAGGPKAMEQRSKVDQLA